MRSLDAVVPLMCAGLLVAAGCASTSGSETCTCPEVPAAAASDQKQAVADSEPSAGEAGARDGAESGAGLDARLTDYAYPHEVQIYALEAQRQKLEMAYMDVAPAEGEANGRSVLLLHGKNFSGAYWATTIEALRGRGYRVIVPDQIGFGKSSKPRHFQFSFHALATHTRALLEHLGVERVSVVGHSMGGMLATRFALMHPDAVEKLALVNPIGLEDWKRKVPYRSVGQWYRRELTKTPDKIRAYMKSSYFDGTWKEAYDPLVEIQAGWTEGPDYERIAWISALTYDMIFTQPVLYEFDALRMPTLLVIGTRDRTALGKDVVSDEVRATLGQYQELGARAAAAIPDAKLVELDDVGHIPQYEAFDRYIGALGGFLAPEP